MQKYDNVIYEWCNKKWHRTNNKIKTHAERRNFLIVCNYGDWSGFRTLAECEAQFDEFNEADRPNFFYSVVERT